MSLRLDPSFFPKPLPLSCQDFAAMKPFDVGGCTIKHAAHYPRLKLLCLGIDQKTGPLVHLSR